MLVFSSLVRVGSAATVAAGRIEPVTASDALSSDL